MYVQREILFKPVDAAGERIARGKFRAVTLRKARIGITLRAGIIRDFSLIRKFYPAHLVHAGVRFYCFENI